MMTKPAFPYSGGKRKLLKYILLQIPPHDVYVEPFGGGAAVLLAKEPSKVEVLNDINNNLITFFRYVKFHKDALLSELEMWPLSRTNFNDLRDSSPLTELQRAAWWYWVQLFSFGGKGKHFGRDVRRSIGFKREYHTNLIERLFERIRRTVIECDDYQNVCSFYDTEDTFFYFDPPYLDCAEASYKPFNIEQLSRLADFIKTLKGKWILSINDNPQARELFSFAEQKELSIIYTISRDLAAKSKESKELLIGNCFNRELI